MAKGLIVLLKPQLVLVVYGLKDNLSALLVILTLVDTLVPVAVAM
jgi:hypothetical protein